MRDFMEMSYEAYQKANGNVEKQQELFWNMLSEELRKMKGEEIAPHLSCVFDVIKREYKVELKFSACFCKAAGEKTVGIEKELAEREILELKGVLEKTPITPDSQTYIQLYEGMKSLYFCKKYELVMKISWILKAELVKEN